jgi:hypothetical protein
MLINSYRFGIPWTPSQVTTALWLDAADTATLFTTDSGSTLATNGSAVGRWNDKSGNSRNLTQVSSGSRPTFNATGRNNNGTIVFNGSTSFLELVQTNLSTNWTCVIAASNNNASSSGEVYLAQGSNTNANPRWQLDRAGTDARMLRRNDAGAIQLPTQGVSAAAAFIQAGTNDGSLLGVSLNGAALTTATAVSGVFSTNRLTAGALYSGASVPGASSYFSGSMFEIVYASSMLSTLDRQKVEGYLAHKWNLAANLPADHPYKSVAPTV